VIDSFNNKKNDVLLDNYKNKYKFEANLTIKANNEDLENFLYESGFESGIGSGIG